MSGGLRAEDVKEAVEFLDGWDIDAAWVDAACAVLRAWLTSQTPDYQMAMTKAQTLGVGATFLMIQAIVDAALVSPHPEGDD